VTRPGFYVVYRWRLVPGTDAEFIRAWAALTEAIKAQRGGLGSRLHRRDDGDWLAYAAWPDRAAWETSRDQPSPLPDVSAAMTACIAESRAPILLDPVEDLLVRATDGTGRQA